MRASHTPQVTDLDLTDEVEFDLLKLGQKLQAHLSLRSLNLSRSYVTDAVMDLVAEVCMHGRAPVAAGCREPLLQRCLTLCE